MNSITPLSFGIEKNRTDKLIKRPNQSGRQSCGVSGKDVPGVQCVIPPHMLEAIKVRGSSSQRTMAEQLGTECEQVRGLRMAHTALGAHKPVPTIVPAQASGPQRSVYDAQQGSVLPGKLVRQEGDAPTQDGAVNRAYDGSGDMYKMLLEVYGRDSLDGRGMPLRSSVHVRKRYNNAFWNGSQMAYGDGDGELFRDFTLSLAVIGHELAHGVVQFSGGLLYQDQSGALNEHISDVFGALVEQYKNKQSAHDADWLIGKEILGPDVQGSALRSLRAPGTAYDDDVLGKDPQPYHWDHYVQTSSDNGGVHINSGIPNHAFFLVTQLLGGNAWERAGLVWYDALQALNNPHAAFFDWARLTGEAARARYGVGSDEMRCVERAWKLVGLSL